MTNFDVIQPKKPKGLDWEYISPWNLDGYTGHKYFHSENNLIAISAVEVAEEKLGPEYHLSVSKNGERCSSEEAVWVQTEFDMLDADEDNHVPYSKVRNFWKPVAEKLIGYVCPCKDEKQAIVEGDYYIWREDRAMKG